jgi:hypothetical protein
MCHTDASALSKMDLVHEYLWFHPKQGLKRAHEYLLFENLSLVHEYFFNCKQNLNLAHEPLLILSRKNSLKLAHEYFFILQISN